MIEVRTLSPGIIMTWTGTGFMRVMEGDSITFTVNNLPSSMEYDMIIRYESQVRKNMARTKKRVETFGLSYYLQERVVLMLIFFFASQ